MADAETTQQQVREALAGAEQVMIIVTTRGKEQQFDGSWLRGMLGTGASLTTDDAPSYGEQPA